LEGFLKALAKFEPKLSLNEPIVIALDASGINGKLEEGI